MALGTASGGWRIIKTLGHKLVKLQPIHGFAAETAGASVLLGTAAMGMPVSTTHVLSSGVAGTMMANGSGLQLSTIRNIALAWIFTLPAAALLSAGLFVLLRQFM